MALISSDFTMDDILAAGEPNPKGRYKVKFTGLYRKDKEKQNEIFSVSDKGNISLGLRLTPVNAKNTRGLLFFGTFGFDSMIEVVKALPQLWTKGPDGKAQVDEAMAKNAELWADLDVEEAEQGARKGQKVNVVTHIYPLAQFTA